METNKAIIFTLTDIQEFIKKRAEELLSNDTLNGFVMVEGILGEIKDGRYQNMLYGISLRDALGNLITINIPRAIANKAYQGKMVIVSGFLRAKVRSGTLGFYIDASKIEPKTELDKDILEKEKTLSEFLTSFKRHSKDFPDKDTYKIAVIHGTTSQVRADFENQIRGIDKVLVEFHSANIVSAESIIEVINKVEADIIVIIRGGGSDEEFDVFNDLKLLEAWVSKDAYKISALGHTEHRTYMDIFSDASCDTPTDAGVFIRRNIEKIRSFKEYQVGEEKHKEEVKKIVDEWSKKYQTLQENKDAEIRKKDEEIKNLVKELQELQRNRNEEIKQTNEKVYRIQKELMEKFEEKEKQLVKEINFYRGKVNSYKLALYIISTVLAITFGAVIYFLVL